MFSGLHLLSTLNRDCFTSEFRNLIKFKILEELNCSNSNIAFVVFFFFNSYFELDKSLQGSAKHEPHKIISTLN